MDYSNYIITIIDNNSTDDSVSILDKSGINLISHSKNYKYAKGYNKAISSLQDDNSDYYLLLNNDIICDKYLLKNLIQGTKKYGSNSLYGAKIFYAAKKDRIWYAGGKLGILNFFISHRGIRERDSHIFSDDIITDYITGCCLLISKENFIRLDGFNQSFSMYGEDVDLSIRAQKLGMKCYLIAQAKLWHHISSSYGGPYSLVKHIYKFGSLLKLMVKHAKQIIFGKLK